MINFIEIYGDPGVYTVQDPSISFVTILTVAKMGNIHKEVTGTPNNELQFKYNSAAGSIEFGVPLDGDPDGPSPGGVGSMGQEKIYVKYKT